MQSTNLIGTRTVPSGTMIGPVEVTVFGGLNDPDDALHSILEWLYNSLVGSLALCCLAGASIIFKKQYTYGRESL